MKIHFFSLHQIFVSIDVSIIINPILRVFISFVFFLISCSILFSSDVYNLLENRNFDTFHKLVENNPNILNKLRNDFVNFTLLMWACLRYHPHVVDFLLQSFPHEIDVMAVNVIG